MRGGRPRGRFVLFVLLHVLGSPQPTKTPPKTKTGNGAGLSHAVFFKIFLVAATVMPLPCCPIDKERNRKVAVRTSRRMKESPRLEGNHQ